MKIGLKLWVVSLFPSGDSMVSLPQFLQHPVGDSNVT